MIDSIMVLENKKESGQCLRILRKSQKTEKKWPKAAKWHQSYQKLPQRSSKLRVNTERARVGWLGGGAGNRDWAQVVSSSPSHHAQTLVADHLSSVESEPPGGENSTSLQERNKSSQDCNHIAPSSEHGVKCEKRTVFPTRKIC